MVLTRVSSFVTTRAIRSVKAVLAARNVLLLDTPVIERSAYRDMFEHGGSLYGMDEAKVSNLAKALRNIQELAAEVRCRVGDSGNAQSTGSLSRIGYSLPERTSPPAWPAETRSLGSGSWPSGFVATHAGS